MYMYNEPPQNSSLGKDLNHSSLHGVSRSISSFIDATYLIATDPAIDLKYGIREAKALERIHALGVSSVDSIRDNGDATTAWQLGIHLSEENDGKFFVSTPVQHHFYCAYKHLTALKHQVQNGFSSTLICEDDVLFHENFNDLFLKFMEQVPNDWDLIYIGYGSPIRQFESSLSLVTNDIWRGAFWCTHCVMISLAGAQKILQSLPMYDQYDYHLGRLADAGKLNSYAFKTRHEHLKQGVQLAYAPWGLAYQQADM
jgi:hypothetical protein